jgi:Flp pilus assembly protein TadG
MAESSERQRGQNIVEMALLAPFLVFLLLIVIDFGRVYYEYISVVTAARVAAELAADSKVSDADVINAALDEAPGLVSSITAAVSPSPRSPGVDVQVTVTAVFTPLTPGIKNVVGDTIQLTSVATARSY